MTSTIQILKTSAKGAHLITDGKTTAWIKPNWMREDGSLTPAAYKALENGQEFLTKEQYVAKMEAAKWVTRPLSFFTLSKSGKAYGRKVSVYECISEQSISRWIWLPASQAKIECENITFPTWLVDAKIAEVKQDCERGSFSARTMEVEF